MFHNIYSPTLRTLSQSAGSMALQVHALSCNSAYAVCVMTGQSEKATAAMGHLENIRHLHDVSELGAFAPSCQRVAQVGAEGHHVFLHIDAHFAVVRHLRHVQRRFVSSPQCGCAQKAEQLFTPWLTPTGWGSYQTPGQCMKSLV